MTPEADNAIRNTAKAALSEYTNKSNTLSYREILDKHAKRIELLIPAKHRGRAWLWLNCVCQRLGRDG